MTPALFAELRAALAARRRIVVATRLADGAQRVIEPADHGPSRITLIEGEEWFLHDFAPTPRLLVVGAVHLAQALAQHARLLGYAVSIIDPRAPFATAERFPGCELILAWPGAALENLAPGSDCAVVVLSHDAKIDDPALIAALRSPAFYIGALGSRKNQAARRERLAASGLGPSDLDRIHGPAGLAIGAVGAAEIAVAILAEIIAVRHSAASNDVPPGRRFAALILAAGQSRRSAPINKLLATDQAGETLIAHTVTQVLASPASPVWVVTGHQAAAIRQSLTGRAVNFVHAPDYEQGLSASLRAGLAALPGSIAAVMVCLGDMPFVTAATLDRLIGGFVPGHIIVPVHHGQRGNPVLWDRRFIPEMMQITGDQGARGLLARYPEAVIEIPVADVGVLRDCDTAEELEGVMNFKYLIDSV